MPETSNCDNTYISETFKVVILKRQKNLKLRIPTCQKNIKLTIFKFHKNLSLMIPKWHKHNKCEYSVVLEKNKFKNN